MVFGGFHIERGVAHARSDQKFQLWQRREQGTWKRRTLPHRADDLEILQCADGGLGGSKRFVESGDIDAICYLRPVRDPQSHVEIVIKNCTAQPRHGKVRSWR